MMAMYSGPVNSDTFRTQIQNDYEDINKSSINCTGIFNEYYFKNTNKNQNEITELFETLYAFAQTKDLFTNKEDIYMSIGLHSSEDGKNFRNKLNLIVVLDISGSMGSGFYSMSNNVKSENQYRRKIDVAKEVLFEIFTILTEQDYFGIILFDDQIEVLQEIMPTKQINQDEIKQRISAISQRGGTNMEIGFNAAFKMFQDQMKKESSSSQFSQNNNRILFLTDANPNQGGEKQRLIQISQDAANKHKIFTTFIGVGLDFNVDLVDEISDIPGANYFSVHSCEQFKQILVNDFNYIVTPIVFNAILTLSSDTVKIGQVYGGCEDEEKKKQNKQQAQNQNNQFFSKIKSGMNQIFQNFKKDENNSNNVQVLQKIKTAMASDVNEKGVKGGVILVKLQIDKSKLNNSSIIQLQLKYEDIKGQKYLQNYEINLYEKLTGMQQNNIEFECSGIEKAVALSKYYELMLDIADKKINKQQLQAYVQYLKITMQKTNDNTIQQEVDILNQRLNKM